MLNQLLQEFNCVICRDLFFEPVTLPCGHTFCRSCIIGMKDTSQTHFSPLSRMGMIMQTRRNEVLREEIHFMNLRSRGNDLNENNQNIQDTQDRRNNILNNHINDRVNDNNNSNIENRNASMNENTFDHTNVTIVNSVTNNNTSQNESHLNTSPTNGRTNSSFLSRSNPRLKKKPSPGSIFCPLCRSCHHIVPSLLKQNVIIQNIMKNYFNEYIKEREIQQIEFDTVGLCLFIIKENISFFPGREVLLHIFEQKYRKMLQRCVSTKRFGFLLMHYEDYDKLFENGSTEFPFSSFQGDINSNQNSNDLDINNLNREISNDNQITRRNEPTLNQNYINNNYNEDLNSRHEYLNSNNIRSRSPSPYLRSTEQEFNITDSNTIPVSLFSDPREISRSPQTSPRSPIAMQISNTRIQQSSISNQIESNSSFQSHYEQLNHNSTLSQTTDTFTNIWSKYVGIVASIEEAHILPDGRAYILIYGGERFTIKNNPTKLDDGYYVADIEWLQDDEANENEQIEVMKARAKLESLLEDFFKYFKVNQTRKNLIFDRYGVLPESNELFSYWIARFLNISFEDREVLLHTKSTLYRLQFLIPIMKSKLISWKIWHQRKLYFVYIISFIVLFFIFYHIYAILFH